NAVDRGLDDLDTRRRLVIVNSDAAVRRDGGNAVHQFARRISSIARSFTRGSPPPSAGSLSRSSSSTLAAETLVLPGWLVSAAMALRVASGSTSESAMPARPFAEASARLGRPPFPRDGRGVVIGSSAIR